jgi:hypothetical protein
MSNSAASKGKIDSGVEGWFGLHVLYESYINFYLNYISLIYRDKKSLYINSN